MIDLRLSGRQLHYNNTHTHKTGDSVDVGKKKKSDKSNVVANRMRKKDKLKTAAGRRYVFEKLGVVLKWTATMV